MNIEINNKKYKIKPASELTVKEYIDFFGNISQEPSQMEVIICYIAALTGLSFKEITSVSIDDNSLRRISVYIGQIKGPNDLETKFSFYYRETAKYLYKETLNWRTLGARKLKEDREKLIENPESVKSQLELAVYLLAVYVSGNFDAEEIEKIYKNLYKYNAFNVFGFIVFFFKGLSNGKISGINFLRMLATKAGIYILQKLKKLRGKD